MTITLTREEAQQVLEHLDDLVDAQQWEIDMHATQYGEEYKPHRVKHMREQLANTNSTIETLRARLSAPEPEPVAWMFADDLERFQTNETFAEVYSVARMHVTRGETAPLYTAPPQREWQGLTAAEMMELLPKNNDVLEKRIAEFACAIEAKLKEKNAPHL